MQCYEYRFGGGFDLSIGMKYFNTGLFRRTILYSFGIIRKYIYIYIITIILTLTNELNREV